MDLLHQDVRACPRGLYDKKKQQFRRTPTSKRTDDRATQTACKDTVKTTPILLDHIPNYLKPKGIFLLQDTLRIDHQVFDLVPALCFLSCFSAYIKVKQSYTILGY